jgi:hypothetical protein
MKRALISLWNEKTFVTERSINPSTPSVGLHAGQPAARKVAITPSLVTIRIVCRDR